MSEDDRQTNQAREQPETHPTDSFSDASMEWMNLTWRMKQLTADERLQNLFGMYAHKPHGEVYFLIVGRLAWEPDELTSVDFGDGWIFHRPFQRDGRVPPPPVIPRIPPRHEYAGAIHVPDIDLSDTDSWLKVLRGLKDRIDEVVQTLAFVSDSSITWYPARNLETLREMGDGGVAAFDQIHAIQGVEEMSSLVIDDQRMRSAFIPLLQHLSAPMEEEAREILRRAIGWHAEANRLSSLGSVVHYFAAVELVGAYVYSKLPKGKLGKLLRDERRESILAMLECSSSKKITETIMKCHELLQPSARTKIETALKLIARNPEELASRLFEPKGYEPSFYRLRNLIAHGAQGSVDDGFVQMIESRRAEAQRTSKLFIVEALWGVPTLAERIADLQEEAP